MTDVVTYLQVNYFNEIHAVWEPLIERVDGGSRRWNLELEVKLMRRLEFSGKEVQLQFQL